MQFKEPTLGDIELVRQWRNKCLYALRTSYPLTKEMQEKFYYDVICNRNSNSRFWIITYDGISIGMAGIENIQSPGNNLGEISLILDPDYHRQGLGEQAFEKLLDKGFNNLNLNCIFGEVYFCNPAIEFWKKMCIKFNGVWNDNPKRCRKFWAGKYYDSYEFDFLRKGSNVANNS